MNIFVLPLIIENSTSKKGKKGAHRILAGDNSSFRESQAFFSAGGDKLSFFKGFLMNWRKEERRETSFSQESFQNRNQMERNIKRSYIFWMNCLEDYNSKDPFLCIKRKKRGIFEENDKVKRRKKIFY